MSKKPTCDCENRRPDVCYCGYQERCEDLEAKMLLVVEKLRKACQWKPKCKDKLCLECDIAMMLKEAVRK